MRRYRTEQRLLQPALEEASPATAGQSSQAWQQAPDMSGEENDLKFELIQEADKLKKRVASLTKERENVKEEATNLE